MTGADLIPAQLLKRKAVVYVRQSTQSQVMANLESQRRQYDLVDIARNHGFADIEVIDDDLGRSASGTVARPGFDRLVASLCAGKVGAVLCLDASRLARNGRDWHHLLELCGLVEARVIDHDGVYNPCQPNDRLLLGMKGSISEFELGVLRTRMLDAARSKARRGELRLSVPFGYIWHREAGLGLDPDLRLQEVIRLIFARFRELGSCASGAVVDEGRSDPLPATIGRRPHDQLHVVADPLSQRHRRSQKPLLRRCLRLREKREANLHRRWASPAELRAWQAGGHVGSLHQRSPSGIHQLGGIRAQPEAADAQQLWPRWRRKVRQGRQGTAVRDHDVRTVRAATERCLHR